MTEKSKERGWKRPGGGGGGCGNHPGLYSPALLPPTQGLGRWEMKVRSRRAPYVPRDPNFVPSTRDE